MKSLFNIIKRINSKNKGQALVEYALIAAFIGLGLSIVAMEFFDNTKVNYYNGMLPLSRGVAVPGAPEGSGIQIPTQNIENKKPVAKVEGPTKGSLGKEYTFTDKSYDTDGEIVGSNWGSKTITRTYTSAGTYKIDLEVIDSKGGKGSTTHTIVIGNSPPTANIKVTPSGSVPKNSSVGISGTDSTDPDGDQITGVNWYLTSPSGTRTQMQWDLSGHVFPAGSLDNGVYKVELRVQDEFQEWSGYTSRLITINTKPVALASVSPQTIARGSSFNVIGSNYDPDGDALISSKWSITAPNGQTTTYNWSTNGGTVSAGTFNQSGTHILKVSVQDSHGEWSNEFIRHFTIN